MQVAAEVPKAFSACGEKEIVPIQHLMARLNPELVVKQVAAAVHVDGGGAVLWGLVCLKGQPLTEKDMEAALREAGCNLEHIAGTVGNSPTQPNPFVKENLPCYD